MSPLDIAVEIDSAPQTVRNNIVILNSLRFIERVSFGQYRITDVGREWIKKISQSPNDQSLGEGETE